MAFEVPKYPPATIQDALDGAGNTQRTHKSAKALLLGFVGALKLPSPLTGLEEERAVTFIVEVILPIAYYNRKKYWASWERWAWVACTAALIVAIPLLLAGLPQWVGASGKPTPVIVAQVTGALTGLMGLQRMITVTLSAHQRYYAWWKASSALKGLWYGLLTTWSAKDLTNKWDELKADFFKDLDERTAQGRAAVNDEQADYFQKLTLPQVDALDVVTKARSDVAGLIANLTPGAPAAASVATTLSGQASDALKARQEIVKNDSLIKSYDADIAAQQNKLTPLLALAPANPIRMQAEQALADLQKKRDDAMLAKRIAEANVAALQVS